MSERTVYPIFVNLRGLPVLVVGGGGVGTRKAKGLVESGALVTVISPRYSDEINAIPEAEKIRAEYSPEHMAMKPWRLVFAATDIEAVNAAVAHDASAARIFCCRCDDPEEGDFAGGAMMRVGGVTVAVSTGGASPVVGKRICEQVASAIDADLTELAGLLATWRGRVKTHVKNPQARGALLNRLGGAEMEAWVRGEGAAAATELFERWLAEACATREAGRE